MSIRKLAIAFGFRFTSQPTRVIGLCSPGDKVTMSFSHAAFVSTVGQIGGDYVAWLVGAIIAAYIVYMVWSQANKRAARRDARVSAALDFKRMASMGLVSEEEMAAIRKKMVGGMMEGADDSKRKRGVDLNALEILDAQSGRGALAALMSEEEIAAAKEARRLQREAEQRDYREGFARYRDQPVGAAPPGMDAGDGASAPTSKPEAPTSPAPIAADHEPAATASAQPAADEPDKPDNADSDESNEQRPRGEVYLTQGSGSVVSASSQLDDMLKAGVISQKEYDEMKAFYAKKQGK